MSQEFASRGSIRPKGRVAARLPENKEILLLQPEYGPLGDVTRAFLTGGREELLPLNMDSVMAGLARRSCHDLSLLRRWAAQYTHRRVNNPVAISPQLILTPFRVRVAKVAGDTVMGFVNAAAAGGLEAAAQEPEGTVPEGCLAEVLVSAGRTRLPRGGRSRARLQAARLGRYGRQPGVLLVGGLRVPTLWTLETLEKHLAGARLIQQLLFQEALEVVTGVCRLRLEETH